MARVEELSVDEIRKRYLQDQEPLSQQVLNRLRRDSRQGVQRLYATLARRFEKERDERVRLDAMRHFERVLWKSGIRDIAGVDEAGVAPLAGAGGAGAGLFPPHTRIARGGGPERPPPAAPGRAPPPNPARGPGGAG